MTTIETLEKNSILLNGQIEYAQKLIKALGNPSEWEYTGECIELQHPTGECCCGHFGIKYEFILKHSSGKEAIVGSTCIKHYFLINPDQAEKMAKDYELLLEKLRLAKSDAKRAMESEEVKKLILEYNDIRSDLKNRYWQYRNSGKMAPYCLWELLHRSKLGVNSTGDLFIKMYKRQSDQIRNLKKSIEYMKNVLISIN